MAIADALRGLLGRDPYGEATRDFLRGCADMGADRLNRYSLFEDLYDNRRCPPLSDRQKLYLDSIAGFTFAGENFWAAVVDKLARRLTIVAIRVKKNPAAETYLNEIFWPRNRMRSVAGIVHLETPKKGDGFLIGGFDDDLQVPIVRWNRPEMVKPVYDDETGVMIYASKLWSTSKQSAANPDGKPINRLNVYFSSRIEKWFTFSKADADAVWQPFLEKPGAKWPTWWTDNGQEDGEPLGIPVVHFRNRAGDRQFGRSDLAVALPFKAELDKHLLDLFDVMDIQGAKQRWATGADERTSLAVRRGEWIVSGNAEATFGELSAENPEPLLKVIRDTLQRFSAASGTPLHDMVEGKQQPSGESRKTAESGLVERAQDFTTTGAGTGWEDTARMVWRIGAAFGDAPDFDPAADITVEWESVETRDDVAESTVALADLELGASQTTLLRRRGFDPAEETANKLAEAKAAAERATQGAPPSPDLLPRAPVPQRAPTPTALA